MSEELRDEHFNQKLTEAYDLKLKKRYAEALTLYLDTLGQEFLIVSSDCDDTHRTQS